jgi:hypothetical protein
MERALEKIRQWLEECDRQEVYRQEMQRANAAYQNVSSISEQKKQELRVLVPEGGSERRFIVEYGGKTLLVEIKHERGYGPPNNLKVYTYEVEKL